MPLKLRRRVTDRLGFRITFLLALALLPLALLSAVQTISLAGEAQSRAESALLGDTVRVAAPVVQRILTAQGSAATLAAVLAAMDGDEAGCKRVLSSFAQRNPLYALVAFIRPDGMMTCSGTGETHDFSQSDNFKQANADPKPSFVVNAQPYVAGTAILAVINPVYSADGKKLGLISLAIPQSALNIDKPEIDSHGLPMQALFTFDGDGKVLTSTDGQKRDENLLPQHRALAALAGIRALAFTARANSGRNRIFAVVPIVPKKLYALSSWPVAAYEAGDALVRLPPIVLPALMAIVSLFGAWIAAEHLVLRHIRRLRSSIRAFTGGARLISGPERFSAPLELREVQDSFERMTETILHDEAELEDAIHQKEVLLREVHHRIKNNLQLIASIMNMQMRHEKAPEVRAIMKNLQDRVMSLATIHRGLYQTTGVIDVRADELLTDIVHQVLNFSTGPGRRFDVKVDIADIKLTPDQAVPLSLLMTEALTNAMKYAGAASGHPTLTVDLHRLGGTGAVLEIYNSIDGPPVIPDPEEERRVGFGSQLVRAFSQQLGGKLETGYEEEKFYLRLSFSVLPLTEAEARDRSEDEESDGPGT